MDLEFYVRVITCEKRVTGKQLLMGLARLARPPGKRHLAVLFFPNRNYRTFIWTNRLVQFGA